jgi:hypothetical protein
MSAGWRWRASRSLQRLEEAVDVGRVECGGSITPSACSVASRRTLWSPTRPTALITTRLGATRPADRLIAFTTDFDRAAAGFSPDRCDALFWAFSELMVEPMAGQGFYDLAREHTEALEARKAQVEEAARIVPVYAVGSLEYAEQQRRLAEGEE